MSFFPRQGLMRALPGGSYWMANGARWRLERTTAGKPAANGLAYRCITVDGRDVKTLLARLRTANEQSQWAMRGRANRTYQLVMRPLLPDEPGCPVATP